ncbi:MAG: GspH/FimT family pseudopilin [Burkholderiales bacterium]|jgi:general secretion pathway protein H|nr:GspH/FimT family pseudopilin [Burkholderiales bacterium]
MIVYRGEASDRARSRVRGMTLLEILVVLSLIAVLLGMAIPSIRGESPSNSELKGAARMLLSVAGEARAEAIHRREETLLTIDLDRRRFRIEHGLQDPHAESRPEHALPESIDLQLYTATNDVINDHTGSIRFYPDGSSNGGRVTIAAKKMSPRFYEVTIDWLTGRARIGGNHERG